MELRVLRYFLATAREGSITKASNRLHITQPTLSRQLMDLEEELGHKLFVRSSRNIKLTSEGLLLKKRCEEILTMVERTREEFATVDGPICGDIYIGAGETYAMKQIAEVITKLQQKYPKIHYHFYSGNLDDVVEKLDKGLLDFGLLIDPTDIAKYDYLKLPDKDVWGVIMRKNSPLAKKKSVNKKDILNLPLIFSRQPISKDSGENKLAKWFGRSSKKLNIVATYNLIYNASVMAAHKIGYLVCLDKLVNTEGSNEICFRPLSPRLESSLNIVWKREGQLSQAAEIFLKSLKEKFSK